MAAEPGLSADPLGEALHFLRMRGYVYCRSEFTDPWGISLRPLNGHLWFHILTSGECRLETEGAEPEVLRAGDIALVPHGEGHRLRSGPGVPTPWVHELPREYESDRYEILRHGGGGELTEMMCCAVTFDHPAGRNLVAVLPRLIHVQASGSPSAEWLSSSLKLMAAEAGALRPGGETVVTRLADILLVQAIRSWLEGDPAAEDGWLGALKDKQIGRAIALILGAAGGARRGGVRVKQLHWIETSNPRRAVRPGAIRARACRDAARVAAPQPALRAAMSFSSCSV